MRNSQKITRIHLSFNEQDFPVVFGIVTPDPDYKLSFKLNKKLNISLRNTNPVEFRDDESKMFIFSKFADTSGSPDSISSLYQTGQERTSCLRNLRTLITF